MGPEPGVPRKPNVTDLPGSISLVQLAAVAVTIAADWLREAPHDVPTVCPLRNDHRSCHPSILSVPVFVMVTCETKPLCHWPCRT